MTLKTGGVSDGLSLRRGNGAASGFFARLLARSAKGESASLERDPVASTGAPAGPETVELDWLQRWAMYSPRKIALRCADSSRTFSYREFYERSAHLARRLRDELGVGAGDRVAVLAQNEPETVFLFFALQRLGAILVPVNFRLTSREVDHVLEDSGARVLFWQSGHRAVVEGLTVRPAHLRSFEGSEGLVGLIFGEDPRDLLPFAGDADSACMILYTSGTTGRPKGALITNKMLFWNSVNTGLRLNLTSDDITVVYYPFFHTAGWNILTTPFFHHGGSIILLKKFDPELVLSLADEHGVTVLFGVPTMMDMMARTAAFFRVRLAKLRYAIVGGEPMPIELIRTWADKGIPVRQGYGLTEFGPNVFSLNEEDAIRKIGSIGFPNFYIDAKIVDGGGAEITAPDTVGELCLRGPSCMPGYWRNERATAETIREGWLHTGDLVRRDAEGYYYVAGRKKEMFISGGENVYPAEVEQFLRAEGRIHEVAVVGVADEKWGEVGRCYYSTLSGQPLSVDELRAYCLSGLAKYKIPKYFVHLAELPKGPSGKIARQALTAN